MNEYDEVNEPVDEADQQYSSLVSALTGRHPERIALNPFTMITGPKEVDFVVSDSGTNPKFSLETIGRLLRRNDLPLGVDCVEFVIKTGRVLNADCSLWDQATQIQTGTIIRKTEIMIGQDKAFVKLKSNDYVGEAYISVKPASILYGKRSELLTRLDEALDVCSEVVRELAQIVEVTQSLQKARLARVDISVDIPDVQDMKGLLAVASMSSYHPQVKVVPWMGVRGVESVVCRSKHGGGFTIYNKSLQRRQPGNTARFETISRTRHLKRLAPTVGDLTDETCRKIFHRYLDNTITNLCACPDSEVTDILADKIHAKTFVTAVGISTLSDMGYNYQVSDYFRLKTYKAMKARYPHRVVGDFFRNIVGR